MSKSLVSCEQCKTPFEKENRELNRSVRRGRPHFCTISCSAIHSNSSKRAVAIEKVCPQCGNAFLSNTKVRSATFCSHSCATLGSETEARREGRIRGGTGRIENLLCPAGVLKLREAWKYVLLKEHLKNRSHEFECPLGAFVFDLALFDTMTMVEFDSNYHNYGDQIGIDIAKDKAAIDAGFKIVRRAVEAASIIPLSTLQGL